MSKPLDNGKPIDEVSADKKNRVKEKISRHFRLVNFENKIFTPISSIKNTKCSLKVNKAGLLLSGYFSENWKYISVLSKEVISIELIRGKETLDTFFLSPIHILSEIGLPSYITRHFRFHPTEYKIRQTIIRIKTSEQKLELIASGYRFERLLRAFKKKGYRDKLNVKRRPSVDLSDFRHLLM